MTQKARISVVEIVYYQGGSEDPVSYDKRWDKWLASDEQPYQRKLTAPPSWTPLDYGWIESASVLMLENVEGRDRTIIPSKEELELVESKIVVVGMAYGQNDEVVPCWQLSPGETLRARPVELTSLRIKCLNGTAKCIVTILPE